MIATCSLLAYSIAIMLRIGLTGGIGSGKSTVANYFSKLGIDIIDADEIVHRISTPGHPIFDRIVQAFGSRILARDGTLNRRNYVLSCSMMEP